MNKSTYLLLFVLFAVILFIIILNKLPEKWLMSKNKSININEHVIFVKPTPTNSNTFTPTHTPILSETPTPSKSETATFTLTFIPSQTPKVIFVIPNQLYSTPVPNVIKKPQNIPFVIPNIISHNLDRRTGILSGKVTGSFHGYDVYVEILVHGKWWPKPNWSGRSYIYDDGTFIIHALNDGDDFSAERYTIKLIPK